MQQINNFYFPNSYADITLAQLEEIVKHQEELDKPAVINDIILMLKPDLNINDLKMDEYFIIVNSIYEMLQDVNSLVPAKDFYLDGKKWTVREVEDINVREFVDFENLCKDIQDDPSNVSLLIALVATDGTEIPEKDYVKEVKRRAEMFRNLNAQWAMEAVLFFVTSWMRLSNPTTTFSDKTKKPRKKATRQK